MTKISLILLFFQLLVSFSYSQSSLPYCDLLHSYSDTKYMLFENGNTSKVFRWLNDQTYESICFYPNGDTLYYQTEACQNKRCEKFEILKYETGKVAMKYHRLDDNIETPFRETLILDRNGDTATYHFAKNNKTEGRQVEVLIGYIDTLKLITLYKDGELVDIISDDILYVNNKFQILTKEEWFRLKQSEGEIDLEDFGERLIIDGKPITFYIWYETIRNRKKHFRWIKKMNKKYGLNNIHNTK